MRNSLTWGDISHAIDDLVQCLGVKEPPSDSDFAALLSAGKVRDCIESIAAHMMLPVAIELSYVSATYDPHAATRFESRQLVTTDWRGRGAEGITAQVLIPQSLPVYGAPALRGFPIQVRISRNCSDHPHSFICVMAHELSHVLLHSVRHLQSDNEFYTDLTPMVLGLSTMMAAGRRVTRVYTEGNTTTRETTTFGYLTDYQFARARRRIDGILSERHRQRTQLQCSENRLCVTCRRAKRVLQQFGRLLDHLDRKRPRRIRWADASRIATFHQQDYTRETQVALERCEEIAAETARQYRPPMHYTASTQKLLPQAAKRIDELEADLARKVDALADDVRILARHAGLLARLRTAWGLRSLAAGAHRSSE